MHHIVETDNFGGDWPDEKFLAMVDSEGTCRPMTFLRLEQAEKVAQTMNSVFGGNRASRYWKVVDKDYKLQEGFSP